MIFFRKAEKLDGAIFFELPLLDIYLCFVPNVSCKILDKFAINNNVKAIIYICFMYFFINPSSIYQTIIGQ